MLNYLHIMGVVLLAATLLACGEVPLTRYRDTSQLESPPELEIVESKSDASIGVPENKAIATGLGDRVHLEFPLLTLDMPFDQAWEYLEDALIVQKIKITDRNREQGQFFVHYDPNDRSKNKSGLKILIGLFSDVYEEGDYLLTSKQKDEQTDITAERVQPKKDLLDDSEGDFDTPQDHSDKLLQALFTTLHDDVVVN